MCAVIAGIKRCSVNSGVNHGRMESCSTLLRTRADVDGALYFRPQTGPSDVSIYVLVEIHATVVDTLLLYIVVVH
jgi:hypothetical protein